MRSETADIAIELSLQPWRAFRPDGVIMFSDILTPLPALGIEFDVVKVSMGTPACRAPAWRSFHSKRNDLPASPCAQGKGPVIADPVRTMDRVTKLLPMDDPTTVGKGDGATDADEDAHQAAKAPALLNQGS